MNSFTHAARRMVAGLAALLALVACAPPPLFTDAPAALEGIDLPASAAGLWAKESKDEGSRARIVRTGRDTLRLEIFNIQPETSESPPPPLNGRAVHFAGRDWLVLDVAAWEYGKQERGEMNGYLPLHYHFDNAARVCLQVPLSSAFVAAVARGELAGTVKPDRNAQAVLVTTPAAQWVAWWNRHASSVAFSEESLCLKRLGDVPAASNTIK